ncbi:DNA -binding domain-containing protein [Nitrobacter sp.]
MDRKRTGKSDPRKDQVRRLVSNGLKMMRGGYRLLLHYPIKLRAR